MSIHRLMLTVGWSKGIKKRSCKTFLGNEHAMKRQWFQREFYSTAHYAQKNCNVACIQKEICTHSDKAYSVLPFPATLLRWLQRLQLPRLPPSPQWSLAPPGNPLGGGWWARQSTKRPLRWCPAQLIGGTPRGLPRSASQPDWRGPTYIIDGHNVTLFLDAIVLDSTSHIFHNIPPFQLQPI